MIDVIVPAYNAEDYIMETLQSIAIQGHIISKVIVIDDGSTDSTASIVNDYIKSNKNINLVLLHKRNGGIASARNVGILKSDAEFIAFVDADDIWVKDKLKKQLDIFLNSPDPNLGVVYTNYGTINKFGEEIYNTGFKLSTDVKGYIYDKLSYGNLVAGSASSVLVKKKYLDLVGLFDVDLICAEDWDMWIRFAMCGYKFKLIPEIMCVYADHQNTCSSTGQKKLEEEKLLIKQKYG